MKEKMMKYARICERAEGMGIRQGSTCGGIAATGFIN